MRDIKLYVIIVLLFLLIATLGGVYYMYQQNLYMQKKQHQNVRVVVAKKRIPQNKMITKEDLKVLEFQRSTVPFRVLVKGEIIGKYAAVDIYKDEPIREEKITKILEQKENNSTAKKAKYDLYNISSKLFKNPNYMLKSGDLIDIIGVWKDKKDQFVVKYIATNTEVFGFLFQGVLEDSALKITQRTVKDKRKKEVKTTLYQYADELLLDTRADIVTAIIEAHNRGDQLWMVLSGDKDKEKIIESIKKSLEVKEPKVKEITKVRKIVVLKPKKRVQHRAYPKATISYGANEHKSVTVWR